MGPKGRTLNKGPLRISSIIVDSIPLIHRGAVKEQEKGRGKGQDSAVEFLPFKDPYEGPGLIMPGSWAFCLFWT
jgi:hypothetical protein